MTSQKTFLELIRRRNMDRYRELDYKKYNKQEKATILLGGFCLFIFVLSALVLSAAFKG